jgi:hypothetical protein
MTLKDRVKKSVALATLYATTRRLPVKRHKEVYVKYG